MTTSLWMSLKRECDSSCPLLNLGSVERIVLGTCLPKLRGGSVDQERLLSLWQYACLRSFGDRLRSAQERAALELYTTKLGPNAHSDPDVCLYNKHIGNPKPPEYTDLSVAAATRQLTPAFQEYNEQCKSRNMEHSQVHPPPPPVRRIRALRFWGLPLCRPLFGRFLRPATLASATWSSVGQPEGTQGRRSWRTAVGPSTPGRGLAADDGWPWTYGCCWSGYCLGWWSAEEVVPQGPPLGMRYHIGCPTKDGCRVSVAGFGEWRLTLNRRRLGDRRRWMVNQRPLADDRRQSLVGGRVPSGTEAAAFLSFWPYGQPRGTGVQQSLPFPLQAFA